VGRVWFAKEFKNATIESVAFCHFGVVTLCRCSQPMLWWISRATKFNALIMLTLNLNVGVIRRIYGLGVNPESETEKSVTLCRKELQSGESKRGGILKGGRGTDEGVRERVGVGQGAESQQRQLYYWRMRLDPEGRGVADASGGCVEQRSGAVEADISGEGNNRQRLHSALGYRSPEEFEQQAEKTNQCRGNSKCQDGFFPALGES
jgi:hypothetical protein